MSRMRASRREFLRRTAASAAAAALPAPAIAQGAGGQVVVIGGGFAGATCARALKRLEPRHTVTLVEASPTFTACPFSNAVIAGFRDIKQQQFNYQRVSAEITVTIAPATQINTDTRSVMLSNGARLSYDRLVVAAGIDLRWDALPGYNEAAAERMPHAWKAGEQTLLLRRQLESMRDGGVVAIAAPADPSRAPSGPYERAGLIAHFLKTKKPKSKIVILDAKDRFAKQSLFLAAWKELYGEMIDWISLSNGGKLVSVDPRTSTLVSGFATVRADVANVIPPQKAARIAEIAGVVDKTGWCPIDPVTFESKLRPGIHVIGDACIAGAITKSAFAANAQAKTCAAAIARLLAEETVPEARLIDASYSLVAPDYGISDVGVYELRGGQFSGVAGAGGVSPAKANRAQREVEATYANGWFKTITEEVFG